VSATRRVKAFPIPQIENNEDSMPSTCTRRRSVLADMESRREEIRVKPGSANWLAPANLLTSRPLRTCRYRPSGLTLPYSCSSSCGERGSLLRLGSAIALDFAGIAGKSLSFLCDEDCRDRQNHSRRVTDQHTSTSSVLGRTVVQEKAIKCECGGTTRIHGAGAAYWS
jgi:hypothetical protein